MPAGEWTNGSTPKQAAPPRSERIIIRLPRPAVDQRPDRDAEDDAGNELAEEQDADPPGRVRLVVESDADGEERSPGAERRDQPGEKEIAVGAVLRHANDRELRGELPQHPERAYNVGSHGVCCPKWTCPCRRVAPMARHPWTHEQLVAGVRAGDQRALARSISLVENRDPGALALVRELYPETGAAFAVGITGTAGCRQVVADRGARPARAGSGPVGGRHLGRSVEPVHAGSPPR